MELTEKEAHCIARLFQGAAYGDNVLNGCTFCKYNCYENGKVVPPPMYEEVLEKVTELTGVDIRPFKNRASMMFSEFPYKKFLKNSREDTKEYFRKMIELEFGES